MIPNKLKAAVDRNIRSGGFDVHLWENRPDGAVVVAQPVTLQVIQDQPATMFAVGPLVTLGKGACQDLMNDLWRAGFRPANGDGNEGQAAAMAAHLADLRDITRHVLKMTPKNA